MIPEALIEALPRGSGFAARAPGRANLIGEHTDYNDGFVLPIALESATYVVGRHRDGPIRLRSLQEAGNAVVDTRDASGTEEGWGRYVTGVARALRDSSVDLRGFDGVVSSEVPTGAGLSSSAALEVGVALAIASRPLDPIALATICRRAENRYVGVDSGIMDQLACAAGRSGHALLIDCRDLTIEAIPIPPEARVLVVDSTVRRGLEDSAYNARRAQCRRAAEALGMPSLRDATIEDIEGWRDLDPTLMRRARHVVTENRRVLAAAGALRDGDLARAGALFEESHRSLAGDFEVSTPALDALVEIALATPGVFGARLTGAGFGGCTVNLVEDARAEEAATHILDRYRATCGARGRYWISRPADGAREVALPS